MNFIASGDGGFSPVEQNRIKRSGTGLRALDRQRAWPGFTLFALYQSESRTVYLIDLDGVVVHAWQMPYPAQYGRLRPLSGSGRQSDLGSVPG